MLLGIAIIIIVSLFAEAIMAYCKCDHSKWLYHELLGVHNSAKRRVRSVETILRLMRYTSGFV